MQHREGQIHSRSGPQQQSSRFHKPQPFRGPPGGQSSSRMVRRPVGGQNLNNRPQPKPQYHQPPPQPRSHPSQSHQGEVSMPGRSGPMKRSSSGSRTDRPNLTAIGQKLGLAVSITSVANEAGNIRSGNPEQSVEEVVNIKVEKEELAETEPMPSEEEVGEEFTEDVVGEGDDDEYQNQFDDDYDATADINNMGEDYVGANDSYACYDATADINNMGE